ncbi:MAG: hypothetical protein HYV37_01885 [Candidatus Levyibacteriota bacterium]|nr:MAG: hypothetical protein HYV37_01885 [Candidatus Levybacteria bacterium]
MKYFAEIISFIFHPVIFFLIMPILIVSRYSQNSMSVLKWEAFSALFVAIAVTIVLIGRRRGIFSDCDLSKKEERYEFYFLILIFGVIYIAVSLFFKGIFYPMSIIAVGIVFGIGIFDFLNRFVKTSNHVAVASAFTTAIFILYGVYSFLIVSWIVPLLAWARLRLRKHTINEAIIGVILGIGIALLTFFVGRYMYK